MSTSTGLPQQHAPAAWHPRGVVQSPVAKNQDPASGASCRGLQCVPGGVREGHAVPACRQPRSRPGPPAQSLE